MSSQEADWRAFRPPLPCYSLLLEVRGLNRGRVIRDVSFQLRRGEILGFAGLMGAGRTEVARAVFGADPVDSGEVLVRGQPILLTSPQDAVRAGIGYLSEDRKHFGLATGMRWLPSHAEPCSSRYGGLSADQGAGFRTLS